MDQHAGHSLEPWQHDHRFGLHVPRTAERRVKLVTLLTIVTMAVEIVAGQMFNSMALLADGLHMGSHGLALGLSAFAYLWMRRRAGDARFSLGTGKIAALAGYTGAILLLLPVVVMVWESVEKLLRPTAINITWALVVAVIGLAVNGVSALILAADHDGHGHEAYGHDGHSHGSHRPNSHGHETQVGLAHAQDRDAHHHGRAHAASATALGVAASRRKVGEDDHNLRSAYLHVATDMLTSVLAIAALLGAAALGWLWLDPMVGLLGAAVIAWWSLGLMRDSSHTLLDRSAPPAIRRQLREAIEGDADNRLADLHIWSIGPGIFAAALSVVTHHPRHPDYYKGLIPAQLGVRHITVEVNRCQEGI